MILKRQPRVKNSPFLKGCAG